MYVHVILRKMMRKNNHLTKHHFQPVSVAKAEA